MNLFGWLLELATDIFNLRKKVKLMSEQLTKLNTSYDFFRDDVFATHAELRSTVAELRSTVAELRSQLASANADPVEVDRLIQKIEADHLKLVSTVDPVPEIVDPST